MNPFADSLDLFERSGDPVFVQFADKARLALRKLGTERYVRVLSDRDRQNDAVLATFPTQFAGTFREWLGASASFTSSGTEDARDSVFARSWACWKQIVHYVPFILIAALLRNRSVLEQHRGNTLDNMLDHYSQYYCVRESEKENRTGRTEAHQCLLFEELISLCNEIGNSSPGMPDSFFLNPLLGPERKVANLFPARFAEGLKFLQVARNDVIHRDCLERSPRLVKPLVSIVEVFFRDIVATLEPIFEAYTMCYATGMDPASRRYIVDLLCFSGVNGPARMQCAIGMDGAVTLDATKFLPRCLYLIDRRYVTAPHADSPLLQPPQYLDLTPFMVGRFWAGLNVPEAREPDDLPDLFALSQYGGEAKRRFLAFAQIAAKHLERVPPPGREPSEPEAAELDDFLSYLKRFTSLAKKLVGRPASVDLPLIRARAWDESRGCLKSILNVGPVQSDEQDAVARPVMPIMAYHDDLFVAPPEARSFEQFFASQLRGLLLVAGSGFGKSTLMAHYYFKCYNDGDVAIFLSGRSLSSAVLSEVLNAVAATLHHKWGLVDLDRFVAAHNRDNRPSVKARITVFIDAINEYTGPGGARSLLENITSLIRNNGVRDFDTRDDGGLETVRIVASCRPETWVGYCDRDPDHSKLDERYFWAPGGDPVALGGFEEKKIRSELYARYRDHFNLLPATYDELSLTVKELIKQPMIMSVIAETYAADAAASGPVRTIPTKLDYFNAFTNLTARKIENARFVMPVGPRRDTYKSELEQCCVIFAGLLYQRMTAQEDPSDYVRYFQVHGTGPMEQYAQERADGQITAFRALLQVGLIVEVSVVERGPWENREPGRVFAFFHDRYAEFALAPLYETEVLGPLTKDRLRDNSAVVGLSHKIEELVKSGIERPVLVGAIEYWIDLSVRRGNVAITDLVPLFSALAASPSAATQSMTCTLLTSFVVINPATAGTLYNAVFRSGSHALRLGLANAFADAWPGISAEAVRAFLMAADPQKDERIIEHVADIFAGHFASERSGPGGVGVLNFVADIVPPLWKELITPLGITSLSGRGGALKFLLRFLQIVVLMRADNPRSMELLRDFVKARYQPLIEILLGTGNPIFDIGLAPLRKIAFEYIDRSGIAFWDDGISQEGANDGFFVEDDGCTQREVLARFLPYICALHNAEFDILSLEPGTTFRELVMTMLNYRKHSIIGYGAAMMVAALLQTKLGDVGSFVADLVELRTASALFFGPLLLVNLCYLQPLFGNDALAVLSDDVVPRVADPAMVADVVLNAGIGILQNDVNQYWPAFAALLGAICAQLENADETERVAFARNLRRACFLPDPRVGTKVVEFAIDAGWFNTDSAWRKAALELCAGMLSRGRSVLWSVLEAHGVSESVLREAQNLKTAAMVEEAREFGMQTRWNPFLQKVIIPNVKLRYFMFKHLAGGLAQCNTVPEYAVEFRSFMLETMRAVFRDHGEPARYSHLTVQDIEQAAASHPIAGRGTRYVPRARGLG